MSSEDESRQKLTDEELMQKYRIGDMEAFQELHSRHAPKIYGYLTKKLGSGSHADDVFQETFLRLHRFRNKYDSSFPFLPWFYTLCRNTMLDDQRKRRVLREREVGLDQVPEEEILKLSIVSEPTALQNYFALMTHQELKFQDF